MRSYKSEFILSILSSRLCISLHHFLPSIPSLPIPATLSLSLPPPPPLSLSLPPFPSLDDFVRVDSPPTPANAIFEPIQHYHAGNGALYALPESNTPLTSSTTQLDPDNIFDGECYASTYQTNGQCHVYQELAETRNEKRGFSQSTLHITKQELPELPTGNRNRHPSLKSGMSVPRFSFSVSTNTLPAHFPYTLPNTPAPSHPYLEAIDSRPLQLPQTPDDTPVS